MSARIYFLESGPGGPIKIGITADVLARVAALQTGNPATLRMIGSVLGCERHERDLHRHLDADRIHGEWFEPTPVVLKAVSDALEGRFPSHANGHADIVRKAGSPEDIAKARGCSEHTVRSWIQRESIPPEHWPWFVEQGVVTFEGLSELRPARKSAA